MIATIARRLRSDRGDVSAISVVISTILFVIASAAIFTFISGALAGSALAQNNTDLTSALQGAVQSWQETPWSEITEEPAAKTTINVNGKDYSVYREVDYRAELSAYTIHLSAPRAAMPGGGAKNCDEALTKKVPGCMSVSGNVVATPDDQLPTPPDGVTLATQQVDTSGRNTNQIANGDFENPTADPWTLSAGAAIVPVAPARAAGSKSLSLNGPTSALSGPVTVTADDQLSVDAWFQTQGTQGAVRLSAVWTYAGSQQTTTTSIGSVDASNAGTGWNEIQANVSAPAGATSVSLLVASESGATSCVATGCAWYADDIYLGIKSQNIVPDPGLENGKWTAAGGAQITAETGRTATSGQNSASIPVDGQGKITSAAFDILDAGTYTLQAWTHTDGAANNGTGTVNIAIGAPGDAQPAATATAQLRAIPADSWTAVYTTVTFDVAETGVQITATAPGQAGTDQTPILLDDVSLIEQTSSNSDPSANDYVQLATIDGSKFADESSFRLSFAYQGDASKAPDDLKVGVYCSTAPDAYAISQSDLVQTTQGDNLWYWTRFVMPELSRLQNCDTAVLRIYSQSGATPTPAQIGSVSVLRVLSGIKGQNHGGS